MSKNIRYVRQRPGGNWQFRYKNNQANVAFTDPDLDTVIAYRNKVLGYNPDIEPKTPKVLIFDIETAPIEAYVWSLFEVRIGLNQIKRDWYLLCYAYKWLDEPKCYFNALCDYKGYKKGNDKEANLVNDLHLLLDEADVVIAHNAASFDVKRVNAKFLQYGLQKPSPYKVIDTLKIARSNFKLTSNKLDYIAKILDGNGKLEHEGMALWIGCMNGEKSAWAKMRKYNLQDITELERVYISLRGWDKSNPNFGHYYNDDLVHCTACGSNNLEELDTPAYTQTQSYQSYRCLDCGQIMRSRKNNTQNKDSLLVNAR